MGWEGGGTDGVGGTAGGSGTNERLDVKPVFAAQVGLGTVGQAASTSIASVDVDPDCVASKGILPAATSLPAPVLVGSVC